MPYYGGGGYTVPRRQIQFDPMAFQNAFNQTREGISQNALRDLQLEQAKQARQREQQTPEALAGYLAGDQEDIDLSNLARVNPTVAAQQQQVRSVEGTKMVKRNKAAIDRALMVLPHLPVEAYEDFRKDMTDNGVPAYVFPKGFGSPQEFDLWKRDAFQKAMTTKEQLEIQLKKLEVDEKLAVRGRPEERGPRGRRLGRALGREVHYNAVPFDIFRGLGFPGAEDLGNMFQFNHDFSAEFCAARNLKFSRSLHPGLQTFDTWLAANATRIPLE